MCAWGRGGGGGVSVGVRVWVSRGDGWCVREDGVHGWVNKEATAPSRKGEG